MEKIGEAVDLLNAEPMDVLGDLSPDGAWEQATEAGWKPNRARIGTMTEALAKPKRVRIRNHHITVGKTRYTSDKLHYFELAGEWVTAYVPIVPGFPLAVYHDDLGFVDVLHEDQAVSGDPDDSAGARESARRIRNRDRSITKKARAVPPADVAAINRRILDKHTPPDDAAGGNVVELVGERGRAVNARLQLADLRPEAPARAAFPPAGRA